MGGPKAVSVHAEADNKEWKANVIRGYSTRKTIYSLSAEKNKLRIYFKSYNLIVNTIEFYKQ